VNSPGKTAVVDHILCPFNSITKEIFFQEIITTSYDVYFEGKKVARDTISADVRDMLYSKGFSFIKPRETVFRARRRVFGIEISVQRNYKKKEIKELVIAIPSSSQSELLEKRRIIISGIKAILPNIELKIATSDKYVRC
jgi:hypothetical protein